MTETNGAPRGVAEASGTIRRRPWPIAALASVLVGFVRVYQLILSPLLHIGGARCRFHPTCSAYAIAVLQKDGPFRGSARALGRILRCHPLHPGGFDPP